MNYLAICEFDGRRFKGWQSQRHENTVQDSIENAIKSISGERVRITGAGRTDSGVSALDYPFSFRLEKAVKDIPLFIRSLNGVGDRRIHIKSIRRVPEDFSARFSCVKKTYKYTLYNGISPLNTEFAWQVNYLMDKDKMRRFLKGIEGRHDFHTFARMKSVKESALCEIYQAEMSEKGRRMVFTITGNRFFHNMVRFLVGTAVFIGRGKIDNTAEELLSMKHNKFAGKLAPAEGLLFYKAYYK